MIIVYKTVIQLEISQIMADLFPACCRGQRSDNQDAAEKGRIRKWERGTWSTNGCIFFDNIMVSGEAILSAVNSGKPLGGRGSAPNRAGAFTAHPETP